MKTAQHPSLAPEGSCLAKTGAQGALAEACSEWGCCDLDCCGLGCCGLGYYALDCCVQDCCVRGCCALGCCGPDCSACDCCASYWSAPCQSAVPAAAAGPAPPHPAAPATVEWLCQAQRSLGSRLTLHHGVIFTYFHISRSILLIIIIVKVLEAVLLGNNCLIAGVWHVLFAVQSREACLVKALRRPLSAATACDSAPPWKARLD